MRQHELRRRVNSALDNVSAEISGNARGGGTFAAGLASEGYAGGYRDALSDILLLLNNVVPNDQRGYWRAPPRA